MRRSRPTRRARFVRAGRVGGAVAAVLLLTAGCTSGGGDTAEMTSERARGEASAASPTAVPTANPTCAAAPGATTAPTDFPHPDIAPRPAAGPPSDADAGLIRQGLAATSLAGPISERAFQHYVDATGSYLDLPVDGLLTARPSLTAALNSQLTDAASGAIAALQQTTFSACQRNTFASDWTTFTDDGTRDDWYYTLGSFAYQVIGTVVPTANNCADAGCIPPVTVTFQAAIGDTYNFDPGTTFARFGQLALDGHAADFLDGGVTTVRTTVVASTADIAGLGFGS